MFFISVCCSVAGYSVVSIAGVCVGCVVDLHCCVLLCAIVQWCGGIVSWALLSVVL